MPKVQFDNICKFLFFNVQQLSKFALKNISLEYEIDKRIQSESEVKSLNSELEIENEGMRGNTINTIIHTLHEKNPREEEHSKRVSQICQDIGRAIGLSEIEVSRLKVVGLLHDIGKIAIEEGILNKPGKLTENEWNQIKRHPDIGFRILSSSYEMLELAKLYTSSS